MKLTSRDEFIFAVGAITLFGCCAMIATACLRPLSQSEQAAGVVVLKDTCTLVQAFGGTAAEQAICATAVDLLDLATSVREERADAGPATRHVTACRIIPQTTVCASESELARAIVKKNAVRDAGAP